MDKKKFKNAGRYGHTHTNIICPHCSSKDVDTLSYNESGIPDMYDVYYQHTFCYCRDCTKMFYL